MHTWLEGDLDMPLILGRPFVDAFLGQHTSVLDHAVVEISSPELLDATGQTAWEGRSDHL